MLLGLFSVLCTTLVVPRFARLPGNKSLLLKRYFQVLGGLVVLNVAILGVIALFPSQILWALGKNYQTLSEELILVIIASCINLMVGIALSLYTSRGWIINPVFAIIVSVAPMICGPLIFDISTLHGILFLNIFIATTEFLLHGTFGLCKILKSDE
jgi:hypothetical protein